MEVDRVFQTLGAFLLADTLVAGFLLNAAVDKDPEPLVLIGGAVFGVVLCSLWLSTYERGSSMYNFRMAIADDVEPDGWHLLRDRAGFSEGKKVMVGKTFREMKFPGRRKARNAVRTLIALFAAAYFAILLFGIAQLA
jgi:hypothetical protein